MHDESRASEIAVWAAAEGTATPEQIATLEADPRTWRRILEQLLDEAEDDLDSVRQLTGAERNQVVADFEEQFSLLEAAYDRLVSSDDPSSALLNAEPADQDACSRTSPAGSALSSALDGSSEETSRS